ncbi:hypothetical protein [Roseovarius sp. Pro17]|uniref:hypothetical protein n=1 Tax=Roseovarius sp. Pro17 TaxID=3108175 RepID=UPI002D76FE5E|nr:hypothetical protein [Roseovarius sp. Pro17]
MTNPQTRLTRHNGKWHVMARMGAEGAVEAVWVSLGGCSCQMTAIRVWLACQMMGKR